MTWVKENYDRFLLALTAFALAVSAVLLFTKARGFGEVFQQLSGNVTHSTKIPAADPETISKAAAEASKPDTWKDRMVGNNRRLPLFISVPIIEQVEPDPATGKMSFKAVDPLVEGGPNLHDPVPNKWLIDNQQDLLAANVLTQDSDGDGFTTLDEFLGKTDPQNKESHPPYLTKLFMQQFVKIPFRLRFDARTGNTVQLNAIDDPNAATQFLTVGKDVVGTKFKVTDLKIKSKKESNGMERDVSEVTLTNKETGEKVVLVKEQEVDSPTTFARMTYLWTGQTFDLKKGQEFTLKPEDKIKYRCTALDENGVTLLKLDDNKEIKIGKLPPPSATTPAAPAAPAAAR